MASPPCGTVSACPGLTATGGKCAFLGLFHSLAAFLMAATRARVFGRGMVTFRLLMVKDFSVFPLRTQQ